MNWPAFCVRIDTIEISENQLKIQSIKELLK
jgi:hypothetical protein